MSHVGGGQAGQVYLATGGATNRFNFLTSTGGTIIFTPGSGTLNLEVASGGESWIEATGATQALLPNKGYILNHASLLTATLPSVAASATAGIGAIITIMGKGAGGWLIAQNATQQINFGSLATTAGTGGSLGSNNQWDSVTLRLIDAAGEIWSVQSSIGNLTVV